MRIKRAKKWPNRSFLASAIRVASHSCSFTEPVNAVLTGSIPNFFLVL